MKESPLSCDGSTCPFVDNLPPHVPVDVLLAVLLVSAFFFAIVFFGSWKLFERYWTVHFSPMHQSVKADTVARVGSTIHALIAVPMLLYYLFTAEFDPVSMEPRNIPANAHPYTVVQISFAITCGYFITDGILTYGFKMPLWQAFLAHHIFAATPYLTFLFVLPCSVGTFILAGFMVVETTNVTLNTQVLLERSGRSDTWKYAICLYTTIVLWAVTRIYGPLRMIYTIHFHTLPALPDDTKKCLYFNIGCAYFIVVFCAYGFVFVLLKEVMLRWRSNPQPGRVAPLDADTRVLKADANLNISEDDVAVSANSPTHVSLYDAKKHIREVGDKIEDVFDHCFPNETTTHNHNIDDGKKKSDDKKRKIENSSSSSSSSGHGSGNNLDDMENEMAPLKLESKKNNNNKKSIGEFPQQQQQQQSGHVDIGDIHHIMMNAASSSSNSNNDNNNNNNVGRHDRENSLEFGSLNTPVSANSGSQRNSPKNGTSGTLRMGSPSASSSSLESPPRSKGFKATTTKNNSVEMRKRN